MRDFRLGLAQIRPHLGNLEANLKTHLEYVERAVAAGCDAVVFPEQSLTGYFLSDLVAQTASPREDAALSPLLEASREIAIVFGFIEETADHRYLPAAAFAHGGRLAHVHHKVHLVTYGLSSSPGRGVSRGKQELGSAETWHNLNRLYAQMLVCYVVHCNRVGYQDGVNFWGGSEVVAPDVECGARASHFEEALVTADLTDRELRRQRTRLPLRRDENVALVGRESARIAGARDGASGN